MEQKKIDTNEVKRDGWRKKHRLIKRKERELETESDRDRGRLRQSKTT